MKRRVLPYIVILLTTGVITFLVIRWVGGCKHINRSWPTQCLMAIDRVLPLLRLSSKIVPGSNIARVLPIYSELRFLTDYWEYLFGYGRPTTYLILLQNDTEMRANGGFFGSYAVVTMDRATPQISFQDIYVPDGQLGDGHVEPPAPIEEAFRKGGYYLRDSDWDPDFLKSAKTIRWFFDKGGEISPDLMSTISLSTIKKIMHIIGPIKISDYDMELTEDNIFRLLQSKVETDFFPGSTQKKDILTSLGKAFISKIEFLPLSKKIDVVEILWQEAKHKNILVNSTDTNFQNVLEERGLTGSLRFPHCQIADSKCNLDVFIAVEANLGANKANCCTQRNTTHKITDNGETLTHDIEIIYTNNSSDENPILPDFFGGNYIDYVRFYLPKASTNLRVKAEPTTPTTLDYYPEPYSTDPVRLNISDYYLFKIVGLFHTTRAGTSSRINITYELPKIGNIYELHILKQHGMQTSPQEITFDNLTASTNLEDDFVFSSVK